MLSIVLVNLELLLLSLLLTNNIESFCYMQNDLIHTKLIESDIKI